MALKLKVVFLPPAHLLLFWIGKTAIDDESQKEQRRDCKQKFQRIVGKL